MVKYIKENGEMMLCMVLGFYRVVMVVFSKEPLEIIKNMVKAVIKKYFVMMFVLLYGIKMILKVIKQMKKNVAK